MYKQVLGTVPWFVASHHKMQIAVPGIRVPWTLHTLVMYIMAWVWPDVALYSVFTYALVMEMCFPEDWRMRGFRLMYVCCTFLLTQTQCSFDNNYNYDLDQILMMLGIMCFLNLLLLIVGFAWCVHAEKRQNERRAFSIPRMIQSFLIVDLLKIFLALCFIFGPHSLTN